ncbi:hypothetical protein F511_42518 [Dorcoceras hygrometricum]|uniref:Uncharacterized protein n=1 Tax=Dorcoceras hygrometricum TaxID=472368 RepID=A0A2Z7BTY3_9LAMI|nr:hypothetical protein F511_42518 [Dorcoceras hygrometricum]
MRAAQGRAPPRRARSMAHVAPIIVQPFARPAAHGRPPPGQCLRNRARYSSNNRPASLREGSAQHRPSSAQRLALDKASDRLPCVASACVKQRHPSGHRARRKLRALVIISATSCAGQGQRSPPLRGQRAAVDSSIRSTTGRETPSSAYTRRPDEISTDGNSSKSWPEQLRRGAATAASEEREAAEWVL